MPIKNPHLLSDDLDTIVALCTPQGSGAIALIRLSGKNSKEIVDRFAQLSSGKNLETANSHTIHHGYVVAENGDTIDEVLFFLMHGPKTFTGQDTVEISCHNNPFIIENIISQAIKRGARQARAGEFAKRSFLNGKIDLLQAESINDVIHAPTQLALQKALGQLKGSLSSSFEKIETDIIELLTLVEASFEFLEEEQRDLDFDTLVKKRINTMLAEIKNIKASFNQQQQVKEGVRVAIIGSVNAGKSTLFNALIRRDRAIVSTIEGTTRDSIEAGIQRNGQFWTVIDTAGLRNTGDFIEQKGIERSYQEAEKADIILLVYDASRVLSPLEEEVYQTILSSHATKSIVLGNKSDLSQLKNEHALRKQTTLFISAKQDHKVKELESSITEKITALFKELNSPYLLNQRQQLIITEISKHLKFIANSYSNSIEYEVVAYQLRDTLNKVSELTGKTISESVLDTVFSKFCIGK